MLAKAADDGRRDAFDVRHDPALRIDLHPQFDWWLISALLRSTVVVVRASHGQPLGVSREGDLLEIADGVINRYRPEKVLQLVRDMVSDPGPWT